MDGMYGSGKIIIGLLLTVAILVGYGYQFKGDPLYVINIMSSNIIESIVLIVSGIFFGLSLRKIMSSEMSFMKYGGFVLGIAIILGYGFVNGDPMYMLSFIQSEPISSLVLIASGIPFGYVGGRTY